MKVFITGSNGFIGSRLTVELLREKYQVIGLARSHDAAKRLQNMGAEILHGSLSDHESLHAGALQADAVIHLAFDPDFSRFREGSEMDARAIETLGKALIGSGKPFLVPTGMAGLAPSGTVIAEDTSIPVNYALPRISEQTALSFASEGVSVSVIRLAQVHDIYKQGLVSGLIDIARHTGISAYLEEGSQRWPAVHIQDTARLFILALKASKSGVKYHAVGEEGVEMRMIADAIGRKLDLPVKSLDDEAAQQHFGAFYMFIKQDMPATARNTMELLNWYPEGPTLISDLEHLEHLGY